MVTALSARERLKVEKVFWFCVKDWGGPGHGLFDVAGKPKPALFAYQAVTAELAHARYQGPWKAPAGIRGHAFDRVGEPVLVLWTPSPEGKARVELKTSAPRLSLRTVANQKVDVPVIGARAAIDVTHAPVFVTGMKRTDLDVIVTSRTKAPPSTPTPKVLCRVWLAVLPPSTTARPYLVLGGYNELPLRVHNDGRRPSHGELQIELTGEHGSLASGRIPLDIAPGTSRTVVWRATLPPRNELAGQLVRLHVSGLSSAEPLAPIDLPVRLVRSKAIEFAANSWIEGQYLHQAEKSGCAESIRFGSEFGYRFELRNMRSARLQINVGANGANPWNVLISRDDKEYVLERSGKSWPSWQTVTLDKYLAGPKEATVPVYVKIQGTDCQVREVLLETEAHVRVAAARAGQLRDSKRTILSSRRRSLPAADTTSIADAGETRED